jgi:hypothetical protein
VLEMSIYTVAIEILSNALLHSVDDESLSGVEATYKWVAHDPEVVIPCHMTYTLLTSHGDNLTSSLS